MENHSLRELAKHSKNVASQATIFIVDDFDPRITASDVQRAVTGTGALGGSMHLDTKSSKATLEAKFEDKDRTETCIAKFNSLVDEFYEMNLNATLATASNDGQSSPTVTSPMTGRAYTPNSTTADGLSETASTIGIGLLPDDVPWPGKTYKIRHRESRRLIMLAEGELRLQPLDPIKATGGCYWVCTEMDGWWGFRNIVSGTYLGHNARGGIWANVQQTRASECLCIRRHPEGGYVIFVRYLKEELRQMAVDEKTGAPVAREHGRKTIATIENGGTCENILSDAQWSFEEV